ncbi:hypothetical protein BpHYR1_030743 [Brachionus plicatilis]|uniref:Uncharacterized protein n=1 Tax=Brachionus plicatilis TaxID=10195 RepID=A0A3M7PT09_BRAPC|nr:hypothetical protein BpHYR1_030743 [Brachionus plicatilis]
MQDNCEKKLRMILRDREAFLRLFTIVELYLPEKRPNVNDSDPVTLSLLFRLVNVYPLFSLALSIKLSKSKMTRPKNRLMLGLVRANLSFTSINKRSLNFDRIKKFSLFQLGKQVLVAT